MAKKKRIRDRQNAENLMAKFEPEFKQFRNAKGHFIKGKKQFLGYKKK